MKITRPFALAAILVLPPFAAAAGEAVIGLGYSDFSSDRGEDSVILELELHSDPLWHFAGADWSVAGAALAHSEGDYFLGVGPAAVWNLRDRWFIEASVMPGYYNAAEPGNDLGNDFEIRSLLGVGRRINDKLAISLAATHKSNAGTGDHNPGVNSLSLRTRWSF